MKNGNRRSEGCIFALGSTIYGWQPGFAKAKRLVERPDTVTCIESGYWGEVSSLTPMIWDCSMDGRVRLNLGDRYCLSTHSRPAISVMYLKADYIDPVYQECLRVNPEDANHILKDEQVLLYVLWEHPSVGEYKEALYEFLDSKDRNHGKVKFESSSFLQAEAIGNGQPYLLQYGKVYRGLGLGKIDFNCRAQSSKMIPFHETYYVYHGGQDMFYPEGALITARDRRTVVSWDPHEFGYAHLVGMYFCEGKPSVFFLSRGDDGFDGYTMSCRSSGGRFPVPQKLFTLPFPNFKLSAGNFPGNPFCAVDLKDYSQYFD